MAKSANRVTYPIDTARTAVHLLFAHATGGGTGDCTFDAQEALNGEVVSLTHSGTGVYAGTFRYLYPTLKMPPVVTFIGATAGLMGWVSAIDITAGTFTLKTFVGNTPTDIATGDTVYLMWASRNSGKNN